MRKQTPGHRLVKDQPPHLYRSLSPRLKRSRFHPFVAFSASLSGHLVSLRMRFETIYVHLSSFFSRSCLSCRLLWSFRGWLVTFCGHFAPRFHWFTSLCRRLVLVHFAFLFCWFESFCGRLIDFATGNLTDPSYGGLFSNPSMCGTRLRAV